MDNPYFELNGKFYIFFSFFLITFWHKGRYLKFCRTVCLLCLKSSRGLLMLYLREKNHIGTYYGNVQPVLLVYIIQEIHSLGINKSGLWLFSLKNPNNNFSRFYIIPLGSNSVSRGLAARCPVYASLFLDDNWRDLLEKETH
jgi:hypothetical protein